jgi:hypothetical protein
VLSVSELGINSKQSASINPLVIRVQQDKYGNTEYTVKNIYSNLTAVLSITY